MTPEKLFENKIKKELTKRNIWHVKFFANGMTAVGIPDVLACVNGRFLALEIKSEKGKPSKLQLWQIAEIRKSGGIAVIVHPKDYDTLLKLLNGLEKFNYTKR